jgi:hypothetical protein
MDFRTNGQLALWMKYFQNESLRHSCNWHVYVPEAKSLNFSSYVTVRGPQHITIEESLSYYDTNSVNIELFLQREADTRKPWCHAFR